MRRRDFVGGVGATTVGWPLFALAQQNSKPVIGFLHSATASDRKSQVEAFRKGLKEGGFQDGKDVAIEFRWAEGHYDRLPGLAADLVKRKVAVIAALSTPATLAAKAATSTIPVVFGLSGDPVKLGVVSSLARPGGNVTGHANISGSLEAKRFEILRDLLPAAKEVAYLANPKFPGTAAMKKEILAASESTATRLHVLDASSEAEIDAAFVALKRSGAKALLVSTDSYFITRRDQVVALAARYAIPTCYPFREYTVAGGLVSFGPNIADDAYKVALYVARILKGTKPAELPVVQTTKIELALNLKTARKLGLQVSRDFLARLDELIE